MSKQSAARTRVLLGDEEITSSVSDIALLLGAQDAEKVQVTMFVDSWEVDERTGGLIVHIHDGR